jgi:hypothetical protein
VPIWYNTIYNATIKCTSNLVYGSACRIRTRLVLISHPIGIWTSYCLQLLSILELLLLLLLLLLLHLLTQHINNKELNWLLHVYCAVSVIGLTAVDSTHKCFYYRFQALRTQCSYQHSWKFVSWFRSWKWGQSDFKLISEVCFLLL